MKRNDTAPGLAAVLMRILRTFLDGTTAGLNVWNFEREPNKDDLGKLVQDQQGIGWHSLSKAASILNGK